MSSVQRIRAKKFVDNLWIEGSQTNCDDSNETFQRRGLPPFYDEKLYNRGKQFVEKYYASIFMCNLIVLIIGYADPILSKVLKETSKAVESKSSYKRFKATYKHIFMWYNYGLEVGNPAWKSLQLVKNMHNNISKSMPKKGLPRFTQKDMAITQLAFIAIILNPKVPGIFNATKTDFAAFVHVWRNIGFVLGIENKYNICRDSLEETIEISKIIYERLFPIYSKRMDDPDYIDMVTAFVNGTKATIPFFRTDYLLALSRYLYFQYKNKEYSIDNMEVDRYVKIIVKCILYVISLFKYNIARVLANYFILFFVWLDNKFELFAKFYNYV